ncbi:hypothetical protein ACIQI7_20810 [Kitasatospora sp. NPDC092039]|uniref:hypothetical protein n=1 Tax=Kitasatospora sp. NPDC092039 TaxID=3364086 RepID=UPI003818F85B
MRLRKIVAAGLLALTVTAVGAGTADAQTYVIKGAYGYYDGNKHMFGIGDTEPDGNYPYVEWRINGVSQSSLPNYNGNGSWRDYYLPSGQWGQSLAWKICRSGGGGCSPWLYETS